MASIPDPFDLVAKALECDREQLDEAASLGVHARWDSFGHLNVMMALERHYGVEISDTSIDRFGRMSAIVDRYRELTAEG